MQTRAAGLFPLALLVSLGGIRFAANHQGPFQPSSCSLKLPTGRLTPCPCLTRGLILPVPLLPSLLGGPSPAHEARAGNSLAREQMALQVTQSSGFLTHRAQPGHLSWPGAGGSGGTQGFGEGTGAADPTGAPLQT